MSTPATEPTKLIVACAWCKPVRRSEATYTHTICPSCQERFKRERDELAAQLGKEQSTKLYKVTYRKNGTQDHCQVRATDATDAGLEAVKLHGNIIIISASRIVN